MHGKAGWGGPPEAPSCQLSTSGVCYCPGLWPGALLWGSAAAIKPSWGPACGCQAEDGLASNPGAGASSAPTPAWGCGSRDPKGGQPVPMPTLGLAGEGLLSRGGPWSGWQCPGLLLCQSWGGSRCRIGPFLRHVLRSTEGCWAGGCRAHGAAPAALPC